jgi:hypothetical protein
MGSIEEIWDKGNSQLDQDDTPGREAILKSINNNSTGISSKMQKSMWMGVLLAGLAFGALSYNIFPYQQNTSMLILIAACMIISAMLVTYLLLQVGAMRSMDKNSMNLRELLVKKVRYLNTRFIYALHGISLSIVLATFSLNLTMESNDGIFELRKILMLSAFYFFAYAVAYGLSKVSHRVYDKQLRNALMNLEENSYRSLHEVMKKHKRNWRVILIIISVILLSGIIALFFTI